MYPWHCCRLCLSVDSLNPIFSSPSQSEKYTEVLLKTTGIKIEVNDSYPQEMCAECINFINKCIKFRNEAAKTQKTLVQRLNNHNFEIKIEPIQMFNTSETQTASIGISEYIGPKTSLELCGYDVTYNIIDEKLDTTNDTTENVVEFVSEIQDIPDESIELISNAKKPSKRSKSKVKKTVLKGVKIKKQNLENEQSLDGNKTDKFESRKETEKQNKKTREKEQIECEHCHKILTSKLSLRNHYKIHTGFDVVCEHCGKKFITQRLLLMHCRAKHGYEKTDKCSYCEYTASNAEQVKIHERLHTGEKPYVCKDCGAGFHRKSSYLQHVAIHLPEKTVQCLQCPARFKSVTLMRIHASRHKQPRYRYRCAVCTSAFARRRNVVRHLQRIHALHAAHAHVQREPIT